VRKEHIMEEPNIHPPAETDTTALRDAIEYLEHLHARMADRVLRVTTRDSTITASLPKRLKALQKTLAEQAYQAAQENSAE
jgi:predicted YcjX-like family ATPase